MSTDTRLRWSIVGVGLAGRARARAIGSDRRAELVCCWKGRFASELGVPIAADFDDAVARAEVVAICSPTAVHADQVRRVLHAGRHAVVEFPVATSAVAAEELFALATQRGLVLHVEHIELLDAPCRTLVSHVRPEVVEEAAVSFRGTGPEGASAADLALGNVARLHRLAAVAGPVGAVRSVEHDPGRLRAELDLASGARATCSFEQAPYFQRRTTLEVRTAGARWTQRNDLLERDGAPQTLIGMGDLFPKDQRRASARLLDGSAPYVSEGRILHVLDLVERLSACRTGPLPHRSDAGGTH